LFILGWLSCFNTKIPVAIKDYKQGFGEDVVKEISILSRLAHDNVIRLLGIIKDGKQTFSFVM
jgi:hypothetical protein